MLANQISNQTTLELVRSAGSSEERDKVFGVLALPTTAPSVNIIVDYTLPLTGIYKALAIELFQGGNLDCLRANQLPIAHSRRAFSPVRILPTGPRRFELKRGI